MKFYRMTSRHVLTRMHEALKIMSSALGSAQISGSEIHEKRAGPSVKKSRKCVKGDRGCLVCDGIC